jgi:hypothetical protein
LRVHFPQIRRSRCAPLFPQNGRPRIDLGAGNAKRISKVRFYPRTGCQALMVLEFPAVKAHMRAAFMKSINPLAVIVASVLFVLPGVANARVWHDTLNRSWEGEFVRVEAGSAIFLVNGKEYPFALQNLSAPDRLLIVQLSSSRQKAAATPAPAQAQPSPAGSQVAAAAGAGGMTFAGTTLVPGQTVEATIKLDENRKKFISVYYGNKPTSIIKTAIAVPKDFDPSKPQRVLITSASTTGNGLSIPNMRTYTQAALDRGWVVMSADGEFGKPGDDGIGFRAELLYAMLAMLDVTWPQAKGTWSFATAGFSGGAGYASHQACSMTAQKWRVIGMLLMNGNYSPDMWEKYIKGPKAPMHKIPVFYSAGQSDDVCKPEFMKNTIQQAKKGGFHNLRSEWHPGGHAPYAPHISEALQWFESLDVK